ncbi:MAG: glycosyltransferase, partial [Bacteroidales bacterium]|nr:glycosyltransferase [Bacteroidales bacterium]
MIKTAIVILNWNGEDFLKKFLPGVVERSTSDEVKIVIADNGSSDRSVVFLEQEY